MPKTEFNQTIEDYLRAIYRVEEREGNVTNAALSRELAVSAAAASEMVRKLADARLVEYRKYYGATLTERGRRVAVAVTRRHRLWEVFLIESLDFAWDQVHSLADQLEHIDSDELVNRLDDFLGNPMHDPHGDPIPAKDGRIPKRDLFPLAVMEPGRKGFVARVSDEYPELLRYAASLGLEIGTPVRVVERIGFDGSVRLIAGKRESIVSEKLAQSVFIELESQKGENNKTGKG